MTVAELIKLLEQQNPEALVFVPSAQDGEETPLTEVNSLKAHVNERGYITFWFHDDGNPLRNVVTLS